MSGDTKTVVFPSFERLRYFHGQMLGARDFQAEQFYFREKIKLLTRCLDGYGVVCGFDVTIVPPPGECEPADDERRRELESDRADLVAELEELEASGSDPDRVAELAAAIKEIDRKLDKLTEPAQPPPDYRPKIEVGAGLAVDCAGELMTLGSPCTFELVAMLDHHDARSLDEGQVDHLHLSVCFCERGIEPTRPVVAHSCATAESCEHARVLESLTFRLGVDPPSADDRCDSCCVPCECAHAGEGSGGCGCGCGECCLLLARIDIDPATGHPSAVHNEVKRMLARHQLTTIVDLNWWHGATYGVTAASDLARDGLVITLSDPVRTDTLRPGVVDVIVHQGGKGNVGGLYHVTGAIHAPAGEEWTDRIEWRADTDETFQNGDRVLITVRGDFVLDRCCRPIDADHSGGRVPPSAEAVEPMEHTPFADCLSPPDRSGPWRSGNGTPGGTFESWLYVATDAGEKTK